MNTLHQQNIEPAELELSQWQLLQEKMKANSQEKVPSDAEVDYLLNSIFRDHVLANYPDFVKYFKNERKGKPMEERLLRKAALTAAAAQQRRYQQQQQEEQHGKKIHPLRVAGRCTLDVFRRMLARYRAWRPRVKLYLVLSYPEYSRFATLLGLFMMGVIILNTVTFCMESVPSLQDTDIYEDLIIIDYACLGIFTIEFLLRLLTCNSVRRFAMKWTNWVDLVAIAPFLVELAVMGPDSQKAAKTRIVRIVRLLRLLRILRASSRFRNLQVVIDALASSMDVIAMLAVLLGVLLVVAGTVVYYVEDAFVKDSPLDSIPLTMYYMHVTLTTTGYGDYYAVSIWGRFVVGVFMLLCMVTVSLPIGVVGGNFSSLWSRYTQLRDAISRSSEAWATRLKLRGLAAKHCAAVDEVITTTHRVKTVLEEGSDGSGPGVEGLRDLNEKLMELQAKLQQLSVSEEEDSARSVALQGSISDLRQRLGKAEERFGQLKALLSLVPRVSSPDVASALDGLHAVHQSMATRASEAVRQAARARQQLADLHAMRDVLRAEEAEVYGVYDNSYDGEGANGGMTQVVAFT